MLFKNCWGSIGIDMCLPKFDIFQSKVAQNCFRSHTNSWCPEFFQKKFCLMSDLKLTLSIIMLPFPFNPFAPCNCADHNSDLHSNCNILKTMGVSIAFTRTFFKEDRSLHLWFSSYWCLKFGKSLEFQKLSF